MSLTMSPHLLALLKQKIAMQGTGMNGMGILGGRRKVSSKKCPRGQTMKKVSFKACRKGKGIVLGGCQCCMGSGCMNCCGKGVIGGANRWIQCLRRMKKQGVKYPKSRAWKCRSLSKKGYPGFRKGTMKRKTSKKSSKKKHKGPPTAYKKILGDVLMDYEPGEISYRQAQKIASHLYKTGPSKFNYEEPLFEGEGRRRMSRRRY